MTANDMPPIDTEQMRARHRAAKAALAGTESVSTSTRGKVEATFDDLHMLIAAIERVRMTHSQGYQSWSDAAKEKDPVCNECGTSYPCATIKAINP